MTDCLMLAISCPQLDLILGVRGGEHSGNRLTYPRLITAQQLHAMCYLYVQPIILLVLLSSEIV